MEENKNGRAAFWAYAPEEANDFTQVLYENILVKLDGHSDKEKYSILLSKLDVVNPMFGFNRFFDEGIELDFEFAKQLNVYDIVSSNCLSFKTEEGKLILDLCETLGVDFVVSARHWNSKNDLYFSFYASFGGDGYSIQHKLMGNTIEK